MRSRWIGISNADTGPVMAGMPTDIAEEMEAWYLAGAADGFNLMFPLLPDDWLSFAEIVVPELQRRGLTRKEFMHTGRCGTTSACRGPKPQSRSGQRTVPPRFREQSQ